MGRLPRNASPSRREAEETTPLLSGDQESATPATPSKPLPRMQMFLLCYARVMEPIAFFSIFPYIAAMVQRNGRLPKSDVGFYSGLIESLFSITQTFVLIYWGRLADRVGRKPVLIWSLVGMCVGPAIFGLSQTLWQMILFRCLAGVFSGSTLIIRTMVFDHCTPETQAQAFSWFAFAGNVGIFIGPIIGGFLADPAAQYPGAFGGWKFLVDYPYAAPGFAISLIAATGVVTSILFLEETLDKDAQGRRSGANGSKAQELTIPQLLRKPGIASVLFVNASVMTMAFAFTALLPVFLYTPVEIGGLGLSSFQIAVYMAVQGASQAIWLVAVFPPLQRRLGTKKLLMACALAYPLFFLVYISLNVLLRIGTPTAMSLVWIVGPIAAIVGPGVAMAFTAVQLALNDASPDPHVMGTLNGIALTVASALRSFVPGVTTAMYAVGVRDQVIGGQLAWVVLIPVSMLMWIAIPRLEDKKAVIPAEEDESADADEPTEEASKPNWFWSMCRSLLSIVV